jgi:hypothetical protein
MNAQSYVQTQCPRCGGAAWGHMSQSVPCGACGQLISPLGAPQAPAAAPFPQGGGYPQASAYAPQAAPYQPPAQAPAPAPAPAPAAAPQHQIKMNIGGFKIPIKVGGAGMQFKIIGLVVVMIIGSVAVWFVKDKLRGDHTAKGSISYKSIGLDPKHADADKLISSVARTATKWRTDAVFWALNLQAVHADGTVDTSNGGNLITYISLNGVSSHSKSVRDNSIKKFNFGPSGVDYSQVWGATDPWEDVVPPDMPTCGLKDLMEKQLASRGITGKETVRISLDPDDYSVWHVWGDINAYFSPDDCSELKKN